MSDSATILIVENEVAGGEALSAMLSTGGYHPLTAPDGASALTLIASYNPDLILLNPDLPDLDGSEMLERIRVRTDAPVIIVSARQEERHKITALDAGANDYVTKPFGNGELLARIRAALRQQKKITSCVPAPAFRSGGLSVDQERRLVTVNDSAVHLTPIEFKIVLLLSRHAGQVLTHERIIQEVWGPYGGDSQVLRVNMTNIRRKLEPNRADPVYILTEVGVGYKMAESS